MARDTQLLTITELAKRSGVSSRTIRFWSDEGLIPVAQRSAARYRLYDVQALSRLDLVRTLRELGLSLPAITAILKRQQSLGQVAATHVAALDTRIHDLRVQRAVLRAVVRRDCNAEETQAMHKLIQATAAERQRLIDQFVARAFEGIAESAPGAHIARAMRSVPPELPDAPSDAQLEAWIELAELLEDPSFAARVREMALAGANAPAHVQPIDINAIREHAGRALDAGIAPDAPDAATVIEQILPGADPAKRREVREALQTFNDVRVERYWLLMATLNGRKPFPSVAPACEWTIAALLAAE